MDRFENQVFREGDLPSFLKGAIFVNCRFKGRLPDFIGCEFHDCDLSRCVVSELTDCALFSTNLDYCDFSEADVRFSRTNAGSPCTAYGAEWQGCAVNLDCAWFGGLKASKEDAEIFLIMGIIPLTPLKKDLYKTFPDHLRNQARKRLDVNFRRKS